MRRVFVPAVERVVGLALHVLVLCAALGLDLQSNEAVRSLLAGRFRLQGHVAAELVVEHPHSHLDSPVLVRDDTFDLGE